MFRSTLRASSRRAIVAARSPVASASASSRRFISTQPPAEKSRSWKSTVVRLGLAAGVVYYYNTSPVFAQEPEASIAHLDHVLAESDDSFAQTIEKIVEEKHQRAAREEFLARQALERELAAEAEAEAQAKAKISSPSPESAEAAADIVSAPEAGDADVAAALEGTEEEAGQQGAFNPETGEINWDCPCLGGMADGPCGEEFKAAFSCFVYSTEEPKGMECIEKFKGMQDCFRAHPDVYGSELADDEDEDAPEVPAQTPAPAGEKQTETPETVPASQPAALSESLPTVAQVEAPIPQQAYSATAANDVVEKSKDESK